MADFNRFLVPLDFLPEAPELRARARLRDPTLLVAGDRLYELLDPPPYTFDKGYRVRLLGVMDHTKPQDNEHVWIWMQYIEPRHLTVVQDEP